MPSCITRSFGTLRHGKAFDVSVCARARVYFVSKILHFAHKARPLLLGALFFVVSMCVYRQVMPSLCDGCAALR